MKVKNFINFAEIKLKVLTRRIQIFFKNEIRKYYLKFFSKKLSNEEFLELFKKTSVNELKFDETQKFFFNPKERYEIIDFIKKKYPNSVKKSVKDANLASCNSFNLLGSKIKFEDEIDWHMDFKSGYRWDPLEYYIGNEKYMEYVRKGINADVIVAWQLSAFYHLPTLGKAFWYSDNEMYVKVFTRQIESWIKENPTEFGINWASPMESSIRAVNWIWGYYFFSESNLLTEEFKIKFFKNLFLHGRIISRNLYIEPKNNHSISCLVGLIYLGIFFHETSEGKKWLNEGVSGLELEMKNQVFVDGVNFEGSTSYHRFVTELFLSATILCKKNDIDFSKEYMDRLESMVNFISFYTRPDGLAPQIGDNDDSRLQILCDYDGWNRRDHRNLISVGRNFFEKDIMMFDSLNEDYFWLLGFGNNFKNKNIKHQFHLDLHSNSFPHGGFYIMREKDQYMIIDCSLKNTKSPLGHKHNSALNFEIFAYDKSFIIDPGTFTYTSNLKLRNLFRSTRYHNVIEVDNQQQNRFIDKQAWGMRRDVEITINNWIVSDKYDFFDGEHSGYTRLKEPVIHRRQIYFDKKDFFWIIKDELNGKGTHLYNFNIHFAPLTLELFKYPHSVITKEKGANMVVLPLETTDLNSEINEGLLSYSYGEKRESPILTYSKKTKTPSTFITLFYPFLDEEKLNNLDPSSIKKFIYNKKIFNSDNN